MYNYNKKPLLIFYETTKACDLRCRHCRASSISEPLPDELNTKESLDFIRSIKYFGKPYPVLILTGGDVMKRKDIKTLIDEANYYNIPVSISPAATDLLDDDFLNYARNRVASISLSLDGLKENHDWLRNKNGLFEKTIDLVKKIKNMNIKLQINTLVYKRNIMDLPYILKILTDNKIDVWELFFLIRTGRGIDQEDLSPQEYEDVNHWLLFASGYINIRTVESPMFRRIIDQGNKNYSGKLYSDLVRSTISLLGEPEKRRILRSVNTRDGKGIIFVSYNGDVYPSGFLPVSLGNIRSTSLISIYQENSVLQTLRDSKNLKAPCGTCYWSDSCGGSRARAYSYFHDILGYDPACITCYL
ncbi:TIGR04053 family radical SAM/SPASM domain-containing protein [Picrophilus oshimae]|uniref:Coenzyme PQQ synthesis protein E n=1 Tax=Picrophilus torridus (strain ATCC 700027 / DSM 9790 / JCM 10055 / NBRC 100828 / KAW 2/3) TaxID=1122961 RepID=Q6L0A3_PICTO|nr:TIGR04053 family radical SAM/SPASM domain-containing protein [Picrophilus oshimae]AAT43599.1 coenzyme PQQ synthesis protein E [Picrophilus oshimae DSM 9789]